MNRFRTCPNCQMTAKLIKMDRWSKDLKMYTLERYYCEHCQHETKIENGTVTCYDPQGNPLWSSTD